jgi:hypothetical protein
MKKLLLSAASILMLSSTAFAVVENTFYLKVNIFKQFDIIFELYLLY